MSKNTTIEINNRRYDFKTGLEFELTDVPASQRRNIDGIQAVPASAVKPTLKPQTKITVKSEATPQETPPVKLQQAARQAAHDATAHTPQPAKTLMRHVVKKPSGSLKHRLKAQSHVTTLNSHSAAVPVKHSAHHVSQRRLQHAKHVAKSQHISRFIAQRAETAPAVALAQSAALPNTPRAASITPAAKAHTTADLLQQALQHATSHQQPPYQPAKRRRFGFSRRITSLGAVVGAVAVLAGVVAVQNVTTFRVHQAASKAGFAANLPNYRPSGYSLGQLKSSPGTVAFNFQSRSDQRTYAITEKTSAWDSSTLRDTFVASAGQQYQTIETAGRTLFLYGEHNATWVKSGIWYQIQSHGALSQHQLVQLATSM